jgi:hypothetical protein
MSETSPPFPDAQAVPRLRVWIIALVVLLGAPAASFADPTLYTLDAQTPFSGLGIVGTIHPLSDAEAATLDFTGAGMLFDATIGSHVCDDGIGFFSTCFNTMEDIFVYRVTLDAGSLPLGDITPSFSPVNASDLWAGYIFDGNAGTHLPDGETFTLASRGVIFQDFANPLDPSRYLQAGETTPLLLTGFVADSVATHLETGALSIFIREGNIGSSIQFAVNVVPEPDVSTGAIAAVIALAVVARRARSKARN